MTITNFMSVDLEDYFCDLPFDKWENYESRVVQNTEVILELFEKYDIKSTFFTLGYIADKFPNLIKKIMSNGHEIASHSYSHLDIRKISPETFENDLIKSIDSLQKITNKPILGFRAPFFSIDQNSFWALKIISNYFKYDSSIFPTKTPLYGVPNAPRFIYKPLLINPIIQNDSENFLEIPLATHKIPFVRNIPIAGGFYLRFLPYRYIKYGLKQLNKQNHQAMFYIHPKDLDPDMPKIPGYGWHYYYNLKSSLSKFEKILKDFKFSSVEESISF
jgi:polysaccharide deacetylase family protein (PEP-CTERM system associated)